MVTGRTKHYISAFGEHVIGEEVETHYESRSGRKYTLSLNLRLRRWCNKVKAKVIMNGLLNLANCRMDLISFAEKIDHNLRTKNVYYDDLIKGNILQKLHVRTVQKNGFINYMKSIGKLGGQNKLPRLSNDRAIADELKTYLEN